MLEPERVWWEYRSWVGTRHVLNSRSELRLVGLGEGEHVTAPSLDSVAAINGFIETGDHRFAVFQSNGSEEDGESCFDSSDIQDHHSSRGRLGGDSAEG